MSMGVVVLEAQQEEEEREDIRYPLQRVIVALFYLNNPFVIYNIFLNKKLKIYFYNKIKKNFILKINKEFICDK
jgi:hypothetical protein